MSLNEEVELLRNIPMFARIEPSKLKLLAFTSERLTFQSGQDLCVQGADGDSAFIIIEGDAEVIVDSPNGPMTVAAMGRNDVVGEIAILCDVPRTATVRATACTWTSTPAARRAAHRGACSRHQRRSCRVVSSPRST